MKFFRIAFLTLIFICFIFAIKTMKAPDTNLIGAFIDKDWMNSTYIEKLSNITNNRINIIIETDTIEENEELKSEIENKLSSFDSSEETNQKIIEIYKNYPTNFLTEKTRKLLKDKSYKEIEENSLKLLYNPIGFYVAPPDKDPYLFATDFVMNGLENQNRELISKNDKKYSLVQIEIKNINEIKKIKEIIKETSPDKIYLAGIPVHTYETQEKSAREMNIICIISMLVVISLCRYAFNSSKVLLPVVSSILFGLLTGFTFCSLIFGRLHILTFVFSTSLIGIGFDYSLHYFLSKENKDFKKSLLISLLSTVCMFLILASCGFDILMQISAFVSFGLIGIFLFVNIYLPIFNIEAENKKNLEFLNLEKFKKPILILMALVIVFGLSKFKYDDKITNLYKPQENLLKAETIYKEVFEENSPNFILTKGNNLEEIMRLEEKTTEKLDSLNIKHIALSDFVSSKKKQEENIKLVDSLYKENLDSYANFLDSKTKTTLLDKKQIYDPKDFPLLNIFMPDNNSSFIVINKPTQDFITYNVTEEISSALKRFGDKFIHIIPRSFIILFLILYIFEESQPAMKIMAPPLISWIFTISLLGLFNIEINAFHLLALILALGFSLDYSIFRAKGDKNTELAVLISAVSTAFSFLLLSMTSFKLISSIGTVLFIAISSSYILGLLFIKSENKNG